MALAHYDIIIVGGNIVGATLANLLAGSNLKIALLESQEPVFAPLSEHYNLRVSALTQASLDILQQLDVWQNLQDQRVGPFTQMYVWDSNSQAHIEFKSAEAGLAQLGHIVENNLMQQALWNKLQKDSRVQLFTGVALAKLKLEPDRVTATLENGQSLTASLVVGADGINSKVRELAGMAVDSKSYGHTAIVATVKTANSHRQTAWQCFLPYGILAFLPLADEHSCSIVWSCETATAERLSALDEMGFAMALQEVFYEHLGSIELISKRLSFPLTMRHVRQYVLPRVALVGDAAHTLHPLAGQGLNLGLGDADCLAQQVLLTAERGRDIGLLSNLRPYERWRKKQNLSMIVAMQGFKELFASSFRPIVWLRAKGLTVVNNFNLLKYFFVRRANVRRTKSL